MILPDLEGSRVLVTGSALACWIVSPEASFNTGAVFDLSGGRAT